MQKKNGHQTGIFKNSWISISWLSNRKYSSLVYKDVSTVKAKSNILPTTTTSIRIATKGTVFIQHAQMFYLNLFGDDPLTLSQ